MLWVRTWQERDRAAKKRPVREKGEPTAPSEGPQAPGACVLAARGRHPSCLGFSLETAGFGVSSLCLGRILEVQRYHPGQRAVLPPCTCHPPLPAGLLLSCTSPAAHGETPAELCLLCLLCFWGAVRCPWAGAAEQKPSRSFSPGEGWGRREELSQNLPVCAGEPEQSTSPSAKCLCLHELGLQAQPKIQPVPWQHSARVLHLQKIPQGGPRPKTVSLQTWAVTGRSPWALVLAFTCCCVLKFSISGFRHSRQISPGNNWAGAVELSSQESSRTLPGLGGPHPAGDPGTGGLEGPRGSEGCGQDPASPSSTGRSLAAAASLAGDFPAARVLPKAVGALDAGHTLGSTEWDPGTQGAPGGFRDGGKEAQMQDSREANGEGSEPGCKSRGCLACVKGRGCSSCLLMHSWVNTGVEKKELS